jgi:hypothetical protein
MMHTRSWAVFAVALALGGCARSHPALWDHDLYLCCNMFFSQRRITSDANYLEGAVSPGEYMFGSATIPASDAIMLPAGTRVRVIAARERKVKFRAEGLERWFVIAYRFGGDELPPDDYFRRIFRDDDPWLVEHDIMPELRDAVRRAQIVPGMTRNQVLMARGYPPSHRTPDLHASEWLYFASSNALHRVTFSDDVVTGVTPLAAKDLANR